MTVVLAPVRQVVQTPAGKRSVSPPDLQQLRELYAQHRQGLFTLALSITRKRERAEDAVHEAFVKLCTPRADAAVDEPSPVLIDPVAYVYRMVRHAAIDQVRRYWPGGDRVTVAADWIDSGVEEEAASDSIFDLTASGGKALSSTAEADDPADRSISRETAGFVAASLTRLPEEQREAIVLRFYGGLTFEQIAEIVAAPLPTVAARFRRGLARLRPCLETLL
jgi:RNA polymerase sigma-70 factor (ECF subfamily)